jgi:hypothetical protein
MKANIYTCPSCGHQHKKPMGFLLIIGVIFFPLLFSWLTLKKEYSNKAQYWSFGWLAFTLILLLIPTNQTMTNQTNPIDTTSIQNTPAIDTTSTEQQTNQNWSYQEDVDKMRNTTSYWATTSSHETKDFGFPYQNVQQQIVLRKMSKYGFDILIQLSEGQYVCDYDGCSINVKFDNGPIKTYSVNEAKGGTSGVLFIINKKGFLTNLKKSSKVMIESNFYERGSETFEFTVDGLIWNH